MNSALSPEIVCRKCKAVIDASDGYCRQCGEPTAGRTGSCSRTEARWWESPWVVLPLLLVVLGPLALPLLWRSRRFNRPWKVVLSIVVVVITVYAIWQMWYSLNQALAPLMELERF